MLGRVFPFLLILWVGCNNSKVHSPNQERGISSEHSVENDDPVEPEIKLQVVENEDGSWGYDILVNGKRTVHQPTVPAIGGGKGFDLEWQAQQVGELMIEKIKQGIMPPSVSTEEVNNILQQ